MTREFLAVVGVVALSVCAAAVHAEPVSPPAAATQSTPPVRDQAAREREFQETMSGAVLVGRFSDAARPDAAPKEDRYTIQRVSKVEGEGDRWLFICRMLRAFAMCCVTASAASPVSSSWLRSVSSVSSSSERTNCSIAAICVVGEPHCDGEAA